MSTVELLLVSRFLQSLAGPLLAGQIDEHGFGQIVRIVMLAIDLERELNNPLLTEMWRGPTANTVHALLSRTGKHIIRSTIVLIIIKNIFQFLLSRKTQ